jgi:hypothetical protein
MTRARATLGAIAGAAMLASHWVAYLLAAPGTHERSHLLQVTGHAYWSWAVLVGAVALVAGLASFVAGRVEDERSRPTTRRGLIASCLPRLLVLQIGGFVALELGERLLSGHGIGLVSLIAPTLVIGLVVQVVAALLSTFFLALVAFVVRQLIAAAPLAPPASISATLTSLIARPRPLLSTGGRTLRGPPPLL